MCESSEHDTGMCGVSARDSSIWDASVCQSSVCACSSKQRLRVQFTTAAFVYMICSFNNCNGDGSGCRHGEREGGERQFDDRDHRRSCAAYQTAAQASSASGTAALVFVTVEKASREPGERRL